MLGHTAEVLGLGVECPLSERVEGLGPSTKLGSRDCALGSPEWRGSSMAEEASPQASPPALSP